jgi:hypothetical protein
MITVVFALSTRRAKTCPCAQAVWTQTGRGFGDATTPPILILASTLAPGHEQSRILAIAFTPTGGLERR